MSFGTDDSSAPLACDAAVVGGGPAGLMAAEMLAQAGCGVHVFDAHAAAPLRAVDVRLVG